MILTEGLEHRKSSPSDYTKTVNRVTPFVVEKAAPGYRC